MVNFFIERPIFASAVAIIMVLAGLIAYEILPVEQFPNITPPQVVVSATYPGASAQVVADTVTAPLEQQINGVPGMIYMSSFSTNDGTATITVTFDVGYPLSLAAVDVQNRVNQAQAQLPAIVNQAGVTVQKQLPSITLGINLYSPDSSIDLVTLSNYAYLQLVDPLKRIPGVADVTIFGERRYSMRVWLDPASLAQHGITAVDVQNAIAEQNIQVAAGKLGAAPAPAGTVFEFEVNTLGRLKTPEQFGNIILTTGTDNNAILRLKDVARIELGALQYTSSSQLNDMPGVFIGVLQQPGSNALELARNVKAKLDAMSAKFPKGMEHRVLYDTTKFISASMHEVMITLFEALLLVIAIVFIFLQSWRTTIIPAIAIPVSLIATLAVMMAMGFTLNLVSMLGMVLAIGLVVDDAIVVVENVERQLEDGLPPLAAAKAAMREVTGPIIATTAVLMAVFIPVAFLPGVTGQLYNQFALTIAISVAISAFNSLTLSPALSAVMLRRREPAQFTAFRIFNETFERASAAYARAVHRLIAARGPMLGGFLLAAALAYGIYSRLPSGFLPDEDLGYFFAVIQLPDGASLERTEAVAEKAKKILLAEDGVGDVIQVTGLNLLVGGTQSNTATVFVMLKPWNERKRTAPQMVADVRPKLLRLPDAIALSFDPPSIRGISTTGGFEFEIEDLTGHGPQALNDAAQAFLAEARKQPELDPQSLFTTFGTSTPEYDFDLDRTKAKLEGLKLPDVFNTLQIYLGSLYVNDFTLFGRPFRVTLQAEKDARGGMADLSRLYVRNAAGSMIPLGTLGELRPTVGPQFISHYNMFASVVINGTPAPGFSSAQAVAAMERAAKVALPADYGFEWTGIVYQELKAGSLAAIIFALALAFVFLFLAAQYESWSMPFMVILAVPLALLGAAAALWVRGATVDIYSEVGFVMLIGLAAKNAILIVEFARRLREDGRSIADAASEAARLRLRPILMTAFAFILGVVPLMLASGAGASSRQSIGTTVFGGMLAATLLSLAFVPVFYAVIERLREGPEASRDSLPYGRAASGAAGE